MKRNNSIEVLRCLLMFGIVLLHCCSQGPIKLMILYRLCMSCVTGFVFISGYFGIKFSWQKLVALIATAIYCAAISFGGECLLGLGGSDFGFWEYLISGNWFLWAYMCLMMFAPMIERAFGNSTGGKAEWRWCLPLLIMVFGWCFLTGMPVVGKFLPKPVGFGTHTFLMMIGVYVAARLFRQYNVERWLVGWKLWVSLVVGGSLCVVGFSHYDSPVSFVFMACLFVAFKRMEFGRFGPFASLIAPSMFSVYLLHWSPLGLRFLRWAEDYGIALLGGGGELVIALVTAAFLFVISVVLDTPRRLVCRVWGS